MLRIDDPAFTGLPRRRRLHDPPAVADRREVRRVHADAAARAGERRSRRRCRRSSTAPARASTWCRSRRRPRPSTSTCINNILRRPYAERLSLIINELGTAVAGRGADLNSVIRRADPALQQTDQVLSIVAQQNKTLADLARDSDAVLAPLARDRQPAWPTSSRSRTPSPRPRPSRGDALERNFELFPPFLRQLQTTSRNLGDFADQATPVFADLGAEAPSINTFFRDARAVLDRPRSRPSRRWARPPTYGTPAVEGAAADDLAAADVRGAAPSRSPRTSVR